MSASKHIDKICAVVIVMTLIITLIFCNGESLGIEAMAQTAAYETSLFDRSKVHTLDIVINDWDSFIETCENEEYSPCNVVIDGEAVKNVGIRGKGNTSLSSVKSMGSSRYSFKIEFDQYENGKSYHGLDKLCLNNIIQDNSYMKDYIAYTLMNDFGVDTPLCSYVYITVNGEDWGHYLAVEAVEESFLERNYGSDYGELYKPDSMSFGGGPGNGKGFNMSDFMKDNSDEKSSDGTESKDGFSMPNGRGMPDLGDMPEGFDPSSMFGGDMPSDFDTSQIGGDMPDGFDPSAMFGGGSENGESDGKNGFAGFGGFGGMGSDDVKLKYSDDDLDSYSNIFNNAKTFVNTADKKRLISSLKSLTEQTDPESTVNVDEVLRYFVVHNFLCNGDSYTGQMVHNYYLYEEDGQLFMIPWDYNLAYGTFMGGNASSSVNSPIDTPVSGGMSDRPMISWIFDSEEYTERYHELFSEFTSSVDIGKLVSETAEMIDKYVKKDPTKFCTYEEYKKGVEAIKTFCELRTESVQGQLNGTIPSTSDGQSADSSALIDCSTLNLSDMGTMNGGGFGGSSRSKEGSSDRSSVNAMNMSNKQSGMGKDMPSDLDPSQFGGEMPSDFDPSQFGGKRPDQNNDDPDISTEEQSGSNEDRQNMTERPDNSGNSRPSMNDMPSMGSSSPFDSITSLILLGVSTLVLIVGLVIAIKFKR